MLPAPPLPSTHSSCPFGDHLSLPISPATSPRPVSTRSSDLASQKASPLFNSPPSQSVPGRQSNHKSSWNGGPGNDSISSVPPLVRRSDLTKTTRSDPTASRLPLEFQAA